MFKSRGFITTVVCLLLCFMTAFISVGYAALSDSLQITGTVQYTEPTAIYITSVSVSTTNGGCNRTPSVKTAGYLQVQYGDFSINRNSSITLNVTVKNNSGVKQYFEGYSAGSGLPSGVTVTYTGLSTGQAIESGNSATFQVKISTGRNGTYNHNGLMGILNFTPDFDQSTLNSIGQIVHNILHELGVDGEGSSITHKGQTITADRIMTYLAGYMDGKESAGTGGYISNVPAASQEEKDLLNQIFGENVTMTIGNQTYNVKCLLKNQNMGNSNDMVLYITPDPLDVGGGTWSNGAWTDLKKVPVHVLVFKYTKTVNGKKQYEEVPHIFLGTAPVCGPGGELYKKTNDTIITGNFNTNLWESTEYNVNDNSNGQITQDWVSKNGELDEAYNYYINNVQNK